MGNGDHHNHAHLHHHHTHAHGHAPAVLTGHRQSFQQLGGITRIALAALASLLAWAAIYVVLS